MTESHFGSGEFLSLESAVSRLENLQLSYPEPDDSLMDRYLEDVKYIAIALGHIQVSSDESIQLLENICAKAVHALGRVEQSIESIESLPDHIEWKSKAYEKLTHLANRIEDAAETLHLPQVKNLCR